MVFDFVGHTAAHVQIRISPPDAVDTSDAGDYLTVN